MIPIKGGEHFAAKKIFMMVSYPGERILISTRTHGLFLYDEQSGPTPFIPEDNNYISINQVSHGIRLRSGNYALATNYGGLLIMDREGKTKELYTEENGLPDNKIRYVYEDCQGNLWLAHDMNITKIEFHSPISCYDKKNGLEGMVMCVTRHGPAGTLYAGTMRGLFYMEDKGKFHRAPLIMGECRALLSVGHSLLAAMNKGVYSLDVPGPRKIIDKKAYVFHLSNRLPEM